MYVCVCLNDGERKPSARLRTAANGIFTFTCHRKTEIWFDLCVCVCVEIGEAIIFDLLFKKRNMTKMQTNIAFVLIKLLTLHSILALCASPDFDFFYLLQQWPGSYCNTRQGCCYPTTGKPISDFLIHGLLPYKNNDSSSAFGSNPSFCDPSNPFDASKISDLMSQMQSKWPSIWCPSNNGSMLWSHEWEKHGTCSEAILNQHDYFATTLNLTNKINILKALQNAGISPNGQKYSLSSVTSAIKEASRYTPGIVCNTDSSGNSQLNFILLCVDSSASGFIECPSFPNGNCSSSIEFPSF